MYHWNIEMLISIQLKLSWKLIFKKKPIYLEILKCMGSEVLTIGNIFTNISFCNTRVKLFITVTTIIFTINLYFNWKIHF